MSAVRLLPEIFGKSGWFLIAIFFALVSGTAYYLPTILESASLTVAKEWPPITVNVVRITVGMWVGSLSTSVARVVVWLRYKLAKIKGEQWQREREDVLAIQSLSLWLLGLFTVLAVYLTQWFVGRS